MNEPATNGFQIGDRVTWSDGAEIYVGTVVHVLLIPLGRLMVTARPEGQLWATTDTESRFTKVGTHDLTRKQDGYWCAVCGRFLPEQDGVIVHDPIPHPADMSFDEEERPQ